MRPIDYLKFQNGNTIDVVYQTDCDSRLWKREYEGKWRPDPLPPFKLLNPKYGITTTKIDPSPYPRISDEIREEHFKPIYKLDEKDLMKYKRPIAEFIEKRIEEIKKEKEQAMMNDVKVLYDGHSYRPTNIQMIGSPGEAPLLKIECPVGYIAHHAIAPKKPEPKFPGIKKVIFNPPATIVFWEDGTKTVVKCENEMFDPEKGLAMAITRKALGNKHDYYNVIKKWLKKAPKTNGGDTNDSKPENG